MERQEIEQVARDLRDQWLNGNHKRVMSIVKGDYWWGGSPAPDKTDRLQIFAILLRDLSPEQRERYHDVFHSYLIERNSSLIPRPMNQRELATVLAALRWYQESGFGEPGGRPEGIHEIATMCDQEVSLNFDEIDLLCESLNLGIVL